jgi:hypothetical protein
VRFAQSPQARFASDNTPRGFQQRLDKKNDRTAFFQWGGQLTTEAAMKMRTCSLGLAAAVLLAASVASAAVPASSTTMNSTDAGQRVIFFNKQGKEQSAPSHYAELWGDAALGG